MRDRVRAFIEQVLPWYDPQDELARDRHTEAIRQRAIRTRRRVEQMMGQYSEGDRLLRRDHDERPD